MITGIIKKTNSLSGAIGEQQTIDGAISGFIGDIGGDRAFVFTQAVASDTWEIQHNLNKFPSVTIVDSAKNVVIGDIQYINDNKVIVYFAASFSGQAFCN